jgi:mRNA-degrading endonuclease RelE of RelBE toxin-antitoxin system
MNLHKTNTYKKNSASLPKKEQFLLISLEKLLQTDLFDSHLHTKKLEGFDNDKVYSFRITRVYRGIFRIQDDTVVLFAIGHRKEIYRNI